MDNNTGENNMEGETVDVIYIKSDAFTKCECGKEIGLHNFIGNEYTGGCACGKKYSLIDNKIRRTDIPDVPAPPVSGENEIPNRLFIDTARLPLEDYKKGNISISKAVELLNQQIQTDEQL